MRPFPTASGDASARAVLTAPAALLLSACLDDRDEVDALCIELLRALDIQDAVTPLRTCSGSTTRTGTWLTRNVSPISSSRG